MRAGSTLCCVDHERLREVCDAFRPEDQRIFRVVVGLVRRPGWGTQRALDPLRVAVEVILENHGKVPVSPTHVREILDGLVQLGAFTVEAELYVPTNEFVQWVADTKAVR